ncbi:uncharacterized protein EV154DRAFT_486055 [Mucor mucedo]|uniref:uncharacterized protein n=1 Tax=Mucor mucedo TaxID=29922 RepID=UPI00221F3F79|nr:uncharacterized protein EV154DRAFT_486055 [Mucor mucedo]KAI7879557.1 hypothetical protein EV154DRAFT_486055 [Mucor mucedo]
MAPKKSTIDKKKTARKFIREKRKTLDYLTDEFLTELDELVSFRRDAKERRLNDYSSVTGIPADNCDGGCSGGDNNYQEQQPVALSESETDTEVEAVISQSNTTTVNDKIQYRSKQKKSFLAWKDLMRVLPKAYLAFLSRNGGIPTMISEHPGSLVPFVKAKCDFQYCGGCKTLPVALVEAGMFPLAPIRPTAALHFSLCDFFVNLRNIFAGSAEKIAEFYKVCANQTAQTNLSADRCSNSIILYNKMVKLSEQLVMGDISTSCAACPEDN